MLLQILELIILIIIIDGKTDLQFKTKSDGDRISYSLDHKYLFDLDDHIRYQKQIIF